MKRTDLVDIGDCIHVCNRGVKKMPIFRQRSDLWRLLAGLFYFNSTYLPENWMRDVEKAGGPQRFLWPKTWKKHESLVEILGYTIMPNHFHLILREIKKGGVSAFMHKFSMGYSKYINAKYDESGSLFQGRFRARVVEDDIYLRYLFTYVMLKNTLELYPAGFAKALKEFKQSLVWAVEYPFSSLGEYSGKRSWPILNKETFRELFSDFDEFVKFSDDFIQGKLTQYTAQDLDIL